MLLTAIKQKNEFQQSYKIGYVRYDDVFNKFYDSKVLNRKLYSIYRSINNTEHKHRNADRNFNSERQPAAKYQADGYKARWLEDIDKGKFSFSK